MYNFFINKKNISAIEKCNLMSKTLCLKNDMADFHLCF